MGACKSRPATGASRCSTAAATAVEAAEDATLPDDQVHEDWIEFKGPSLEEALKVVPEHSHSPMRLVDATYLLRLAGYEKDEAGIWSKRSQPGTMKRRQELPAEAFVPLSALQKLARTRGSPGLPILAVSYPWLQPDHPDPRGDSLRLLAYALASLVIDKGMFAVFIDFMSLHQKAPDGTRTDGEEILFGNALGMLSEVYSHLYTRVFKISVLPDGYPEGFVFPADCSPNKAEYYGRGWCYCESSVASLAKASSFVLDLGKIGTLDQRGFEPFTGSGSLIDRCVAGRRAPLTPEEFELELENKSFTSKNADFRKVVDIYKDAFQKRFGESTALSFISLGWGDAEAEALSRVLTSGAAPALEELWLGGNQIGTGGFEALARAVRTGAVPLLRRAEPKDNPGDARSLMEAVRAQNSEDPVWSDTSCAESRGYQLGDNLRSGERFRLMGEG